MRLFFSGNVNEEQYDSLRISKRYAKLSRIRVIRALDRCLGESDKRRIGREKDLTDVLEGGHRGFTWIEDPSLRVEMSEWLGLLSKCDFFLACPGVAKPMSHNCIEAMSVGCDPGSRVRRVFSSTLDSWCELLGVRGRSGTCGQGKRVVRSFRGNDLEVEARRNRLLRSTPDAARFRRKNCKIEGRRQDRVSGAEDP